MFSDRFLIETGLFLIFSVPISFSDIKSFRIPLFYTFAGIVFFLAFRIFLVPGPLVPKIEDIAASLVSSLAVLFLTRIFSSGGLGKGDIIFGAFASLYCVWWKNLAGLLFAALLGILAYLFLSAVDKIRKSKNILHPLFAFPFVPFISAGAILARIFFG